MPVTIKVNGTMNSLIHKGCNGISMATIPDVCKTPTPAGPVPIPYPNIAQAAMLAKGTTTVKVDGGMMAAIKGSEFSMSNGDEAGTAGGVKSSTFIKEATWILYSFDVKLDGKEACRFMDKMFHNHENAANMSGIVSTPVVVAPGPPPPPPPCAHEWDLTEPESPATADQKKARLRKGTPGDKFEADAADHNKVTDGKCMSGPNAQSKMYMKCKKCGYSREVDHVKKDEKGKVVEIVECKSGRCHIDPAQVADQMECGKQLGASVTYKLQTPGATEGAKHLPPGVNCIPI